MSPDPVFIYSRFYYIHILAPCMRCYRNDKRLFCHLVLHIVIKEGSADRAYTVAFDSLLHAGSRDCLDTLKHMGTRRTAGSGILPLYRCICFCRSLHFNFIRISLFLLYFRLSLFFRFCSIFRLCRLFILSFI